MSTLRVNPRKHTKEDDRKADDVVEQHRLAEDERLEDQEGDERRELSNAPEGRRLEARLESADAVGGHLKRVLATGYEP